MCREIHSRNDEAFNLHDARQPGGRCVQRHTAGLGDIGPLAGKPLMEGKAILFKRLVLVDSGVFDIGLDIRDPDEMVRTVRALELTFGGINLEDIKPPVKQAIYELASQVRRNVCVRQKGPECQQVVSEYHLTNSLEMACNKKSLGKSRRCLPLAKWHGTC